MKKAIRKWTAGWLTIAFAWMVFGLISPGPLKAGIAKAESAASTVEAAKNSYPESRSFEKEGNNPEIAKKKKSPWFWVAAGAVVAGIIIYFTLIKKPKYGLTVETGTGVTGNPAAGKHSYKKGKEIAYNFTCTDGYKNLTVLLDGKTSTGSGTIIMDQAHTLKVTAVPLSEYILTITIDNGISGTPVNGTYQYREGTVVHYQYSLGTQALAVTLDDVSVPQSGSFVMDNDHILKVQIVYTLTVKIDNGINGTPAAGVYHYPKGTAVPYHYSNANLVILDNNLSSLSGSILMDKDHILKLSFVDIRGKWRLQMKGTRDTLPSHQFDISFSGTQTKGVFEVYDVTNDADGQYLISSLIVSMEISMGWESHYFFSGNFASNNMLSGNYKYIDMDYGIYNGKGIWTASRIK